MYTQTQKKAHTHTHTHTHCSSVDELLKNIVKETSEAVRTLLWLIFCDSVCRVTVKSDDLVIEGAAVCSQMLSRLPYVSSGECISPQ